MQVWRDRIRSLTGRLQPEAVAQLAQDARQRLDAVSGSLHLERRRFVSGLRGRLTSAVDRLETVSPMATIARGFAVVTREDGAIVRSVGTVSPGDEIAVRVSDGILDAIVAELRRNVV